MSDGRDRAEYVIHAKLKNNLLLSRILERADNVNQFCSSEGLCPSQVGYLINMKQRALNKSGAWSMLATRLSEALDCFPEDLFSEEQREVELTSNAAYVEMTRQQMLASTDPLKQIEDKMTVAALMRRAGLTTRERIVMNAITHDASLGEIATSEDITRERVHQVEQRALCKLSLAA